MCTSLRSRWGGRRPDQGPLTAKSPFVAVTDISAKQGSRLYVAVIATKSIHGVSTIPCQKGFSRYCWRISFKVLEVLFLAQVSQAFLPSKKACGIHTFQHFWVRQQYRLQ